MGVVSPRRNQWIGSQYCSVVGVVWFMSGAVAHAEEVGHASLYVTLAGSFADSATHGKSQTCRAGSYLCTAL